ncbi:hypothetical protein R1sor_013322 [Riccia sorocarpa]|uniref:Stress response protein NST1 n=1 Tax=Riccia sorocarpa TaxID=122646 RepID=A0ABD3H6C3_9MARC
MPSLKALHSHRASSPSHLFVADGRSAVWSRSNTEDVSLSQLHKFWSGLSSSQRRELLRIDKQALFEQVRKNLYCSRCHGLLVEGYAQIVSYGKSLQAGLLGYSNGSAGCNKHLSEVGAVGANSSLQDDTRDPSVHPWGGLAATRDSMLTVLDCFLDGTPLEVFESARARERERELLYPDACGGGGRGWISQSTGGYGGNGRGHGLKETCALHTARLSCEALVDFWSALGEETRRSLLRMKEEDFIERLMFRFDSKRFCRDCRRNVLREFKEMKELKRSRKEPRCTRWFCAADTSFRYEVSDTTVQVDWRDCFAGDVGSVYQRFEWALGTSEGKADILGFEDVGLSESIQVEGLDLGNTAACFITVRAWKRDGKCNELSAKAHALKGQLCVHRRLIVGDGYVSITKGESIQRFFERAEETEEEEDDDSMDKDGNELDGGGSRPQKHAKSPELARDFLLDAATVIFKEQVEKAFREGTARQNAHSIFVCLALSLLEERVRVACKEITTLEKQNKLLEEEEDEKREEEERRERRKLKEKEKRQRRKEKLKGKERDKDKSKPDSKATSGATNGCVIAASTESEEAEDKSGEQEEESPRQDRDSISARPSSPDMAEARQSADGLEYDNGGGNGVDSSGCAHDIEDTLSMRDGNGAFIVERTKSSKRRSQIRQLSEGGSMNGLARRNYPYEMNGTGRNSAKVVPAPALDYTFHEKTSAGSLTNGKHTSHRIGPDTVSKRTDGWHRAHVHAQQRSEDYQYCGCGGPQNGVRMKGNQRNISRIGSKEYIANKIVDRVDTGLRVSTRNGNYELGYSYDRGDRGKVIPVSTAKRKGEREQDKSELGAKEIQRPGHTRSASAGELGGGGTNGFHGFVNGNFTHSGHENGSQVKTAWVPASSGSLGNTVSRSSSFVERNFSHTSHKAITSRPVGRVRQPGAVYQGKPSGAVSDGVLLPGTTGDQLQAPRTATNGGHSDSNLGALSLDRVASNSNLTAKVQSTVGSDPATSRHGLGLAADSPVVPKSNELSDEGSEKMKSESIRSVSSPQFGMPIDPAKSLVTPPVGMELPAFQPAESANPPTSSVGAQDNGPLPAQAVPISNGLKIVQSVQPPKELLNVQGSMQPLPVQTILSGQMHLQPQQSYGFYQQQQGSWGLPRSRNGVLPLPQPGGFLIPPTGLGMTMAALPPMSIAQAIPPGMAVGRMATLPNGMNTLPVRDSVFLSRFGPGPNGGADGRGPPGSQLVPPGEPVKSSPLHGQDGLLHSGDTGTAVNGTIMQKEDICDSHSQADTSGFSLFHFGGPAAVAQKEVDSPPLVAPLKESKVSDSRVETLSDTRRCGPLDELSGGSKDMSASAGEYSLFATQGKGLVFF